LTTGYKHDTNIVNKAKHVRFNSEVHIFQGFNVSVAESIGFT